MKANIGIEIDLEIGVESRFLITANSGAGKSYAIRKLLEETNGKIQQIILDLEGEFASLREKYDLVVFGKDGDVPLNVRYAAKYANEILSLGVSAVIDLYELKHHERISFVKNFLDAMINAPKELWHPVIIVVDEAHIFAPESSKAESADAVKDLCTRGRKRGFCAVLATQRLSKLNKDAAAECLNKLIGRTSLDIDMKRAADELGFNNKQDMLSLRDLDKGEFYAFGPAINNHVTKFKVLPVQTTHPKVGTRIVNVPAPNEKIRKVLSQLSNLPAEAEKEIKDINELKKENALLKSQLTRLKNEKPLIDHSAVQELKAENQKLKANYTEADKERRAMHMSIMKAMKLFVEYTDKIEGDVKVNIVEQRKYEEEYTRQIRKPAVKQNQYQNKPLSIGDDEIKLGKCAFAVLKFISVRPDKYFSYAQIGGMTGYSPNSGSFSNSVSELSTKGLIEKDGRNLKLSEAGAEYLSTQNIIAGEGDYSPEIWLNKLPTASKKIYEVLLNHPGQEFPKEELAEITGYSVSGSFDNAISKLCVLELAQRNRGSIKLNEELENY